MLTKLCLYRKHKVYMAYNIKCRTDVEGLLKVTCNHIRRNSGNILEMLQDNEMVTMKH